MKIIDTPEFQRLRNIKQLGGCSYVYPGAVHTRFEHSIGTCHIALQLIEHLENNIAEKNVKITKEEKLCVGIAALCHDLGHGPFSHLFDRGVIPRINKENPTQHEMYSIKIFDRMMENGLIKKYIKDAGYEMEAKYDHYHCIKEMIYGPFDEKTLKRTPEYKFEDKEKRFLYEIVSNEATGIDVDKWDYFARDCYYLGIHNNFDYKRFIKFARVIEHEGYNRICFRHKEEHNVYEMFHTRYRLYRQAYFHRATTGIEEMIEEGITGDLEGYLAMDDHIVTLILHSGGTELKEARDLLKRVTQRDVYKLIKKTELKKPVKGEDIESVAKHIVGYSGGIRADDIVCKMRKFAYWKGNENPVKTVLFYNKEDENKAFKVESNESSEIQPLMYETCFIYVYVKDMAQLEDAKKAVDNWNKSGKDRWLEGINAN
ncbi:deoxynucleoside triphosphate triphosphohydrolase SAMHD1-like [Saccoglossus kowalevskii]